MAEIADSHFGDQDSYHTETPSRLISRDYLIVHRLSLLNGFIFVSVFFPFSVF